MKCPHVVLATLIAQLSLIAAVYVMILFCAHTRLFQKAGEGVGFRGITWPEQVDLYCWDSVT